MTILAVDIGYSSLKLAYGDTRADLSALILPSIAAPKRRMARVIGGEDGDEDLEVMWLLKGLQPGYHTIADFRKDNAKALKAVNRQFMLLCREPGLYGGTRVGLDVSFFNGNAGAGSIKTKQQLERELAALERDIERYHEEIDTADAGEASGPAQPTLTAEQLAALQERARRRRDQLKVLAETGETQLSRTDPDARRLTKNGKQVTGYNVQIVVDDRHGLILTHEVTNAGNDYGQLTVMAEQSRQALADNAPRAQRSRLRRSSPTAAISPKRRLRPARRAVSPSMSRCPRRRARPTPRAACPAAPSITTPSWMSTSARLAGTSRRAGSPRPRTVSCASVTAATSATAGRARSATPVCPRRPRAGKLTAPSMPMPWIATARGWPPPPRRCANALRSANIRSGR